jgi:hypothetical protein
MNYLLQGIELTVPAVVEPHEVELQIHTDSRDGTN